MRGRLNFGGEKSILNGRSKEGVSIEGGILGERISKKLQK